MGHGNGVIESTSFASTNCDILRHHFSSTPLKLI